MHRTYRMVYVTTPNREEALSLGRTLVTEKLAACANVLGAIQSVFVWQGELNDAEEVAVILKTSAERLPALMARTRELHSYECPCIVTLPLQEISADYARWLDEQLTLPSSAK